MNGQDLFDLLNEDGGDDSSQLETGRDYLDTDVSAKSPYAYFMRVDPAMRDFLGPIETVDDELTGRTLRRRWAKIAMVRGAADDHLKEVTVYLDPFPHIRIDKPKDLQGWYSSKHDGDLRGQRDRPCMTDAILTQPYGGWCNVGCTFCYINSGAKGYRGSGLVTVPLGYGSYVKRALGTMTWGTAGYFSSFTDPFLELEAYYHNTQEGVRAFTDAGLPIFFLSRLAYPSWAFDELKKSPFSYAQKSLNTPDGDVFRKLSPGAISLEAHLDEIRDLHRAGIYVSIQCNPIIPGVVNHEDVEHLFERLAAVGTDHVIVKFVEANHPWAKALVERIGKKFPGAPIERFQELFTENSCGGQKTIVESYRRDGHRRYQALATKLNMTYSLCYEYTHRPDGRWVSMGPEYLTAEQCHGHRVPIHVKRGDRFEPLEVCPPSGCLQCGDTHETVPCGSVLLPQARSWQLKDFKQDPWVSAATAVIIPLRSV